MSFTDAVRTVVDDNIELLAIDGLGRLKERAEFLESRKEQHKNEIEDLNHRLEKKDKYISELEDLNAKVADESYAARQESREVKDKLETFDELSIEVEVLRRTAAMHEQRATTAMELLREAQKVVCKQANCPKA